MRRLGAFLLIAWLAVPVQAAVSPTDTGQDWLERLQLAEQQHSYQGTFVYERNGSFSTHAIWHRVEANGQVRERLVQLDGPAQEMLRLDAQLQCISSAHVEQPAAGLVMQQLQPAQLAAHYDLRILGQARVAGRAAVVLALLPRDQYRYGLELYLDQQTGLALKSLLLNQQGQLLERFQFIQLDSRSALSDAELQPDNDCLAVSPAPVTPAPTVVSAWQTGWLPPGFSLISTEQRAAQTAGGSLTWLMFSDGLARFSVFIEALPSAGVEKIHRQVGPTVVVSQQMQGVSGPVMVTVVGEVPLVAAERVVVSMGLATEPARP
jgi:sigma-E factor negative regulatory protein RseB